MLKKAVLGFAFGGAAGILVAMRSTIEEETTHPHKLLSILQTNTQFTRLQADPNFEQKTTNQLQALNQVGGLLSHKLFVDKKVKGHTVSFVYAGSRSCGFPFIVHGGLLGTLLDDAVCQASEGLSPWSHLTINFKRPTRTNQFLVIETNYSDNKYTAQIRNLKGKLLVDCQAN